MVVFPLRQMDLPNRFNWRCEPSSTSPGQPPRLGAQQSSQTCTTENQQDEPDVRGPSARFSVADQLHLDLKPRLDCIE